MILKVASPGVTDFYQGTEFWDFNLVDPDNRRAVDFAARAAFLKEIRPLLEDSLPIDERKEALQALVQDWPSGELKFFCTAAALNLRRRCKDLFLFGEYTPLEIHGGQSSHLVALGRQLDQDAVIAIAPRVSSKLSAQAHGLPLGPECWHDTTVALASSFQHRPYRDLFTGEVFAAKEQIAAGTALSILPVSLLVAQR
ncbi:MAG: hypothetical protein WBD67_08215 [Terracidiphilus sp.]